MQAIHPGCTDIAPWKLEKYWSERVTGRFTGVEPKWTYQKTLAQMNGTEPSKQLEDDEMLDFTANFNEKTWESTRGALEHFENAERTHSRYG
jgi:hypothetical protein